MGYGSPRKRQFWGGMARRNCMTWTVQTRLDRSRYRLVCGLGWAVGSRSSIVFARWRQCALHWGHIDTTWRIRLNRSSAAVMRPYVKLLWPLVSSTPWVKKGCHPNNGYNFVNSWWICKILSLLQRAVNFQLNQYWVTHHTLSMLLLYLGKLKNQKFAILMHVKHVSNATFYHLSNRCLPNVMKINVKINTMQNTNILLFVRSLSLTYWGNA